MKSGVLVSVESLGAVFQPAAPLTANVGTKTKTSRSNLLQVIFLDYVNVANTWIVWARFWLPISGCHDWLQRSIYWKIPHHWKKDPRAHLDNPQDARRLAELFPGQVSIVKYEEVARKPKATLPIILKVPKSLNYKIFLNTNWMENEKKPFQFLGLPWHPSLTKFMADHMVEDAK